MNKQLGSLGGYNNKWSYPSVCPTCHKCPTCGSYGYSPMPTWNYQGNPNTTAADTGLSGLRAYMESQIGSNNAKKTLDSGEKA